MRIRALLLAVVLAILLMLLGSGVAQAAGPQLGLSWDGKTWSTQLSGTLFNRPGSIRYWVPGDADTKSFYVRNQTTDLAVMELDYELPASATLLQRGDFSFQIRVGGGAWMPLAGTSGWVPLSSSSIAGGQVSEVDVRATFTGASTNPSQTQVLPLDFRVVMTQDVRALTNDAGGSGGGTHGHGHGHGSGGSGLSSVLAMTGGPALRWAVAALALCGGGGLALLIGRRRRREEDDDVDQDQQDQLA